MSMDCWQEIYCLHAWNVVDINKNKPIGCHYIVYIEKVDGFPALKDVWYYCPFCGESNTVLYKHNSKSNGFGWPGEAAIRVSYACQNHK